MTQLPCIYAIVLVARFQQRVLARVAYDHFGHVRLEQVVQPGGTSAFLERYPQSSLQSLEKFQDGSCFRFDQGLHYQFSAGVPDRNGYACLMHIHANILCPIHGGAPFRRPEPT